MTQRASLFTTVLLVLGVEACSGDTNGALFGSTDHPTNNAGGSASTGGGGDPSGGSENGSSGGSSSGGAQGGTASGGSPTAGTGGAAATGGAASGGGTIGASGGARATGGATATGGRKADAGSGGSAPATDAGSGGEIDSGPGTGGAPPVDSGGGTGGFTGDAKIRCGETACDKAAGEICCVKETSQKTTATCEANAQGCAHVFRCDSDNDCARGEHCCMEFPNAVNTPSTSCARECSSPLSCSVPEDCDNGQSCCGVVAQGPVAGVRYGSVTCQDKCGQDTPFCIDNSECNNNTSCQQSQTLPPGYTVCR